MIRASVTVVCVMMAVCSGCGTKALTTKPCDDKSHDGVVYALPKTLLKVTVPYTVVKRTVVENGVTRQEPPTIEVRKPIKIEAIHIGDPQNVLVLGGGELLDSATLDSSTKLTVGPNLMLNGFEADVTDKTPQVVESLFSTAISVAKLAVAAGEAKGEPITSIRARLEEIGKDIAVQVSKLQTATTQQARDDIKKTLETLMTERKMLLDVAKAYEDANSESVQTTDIEYVVTVDPSDTDAFKVAAGSKSGIYQVKPPTDIFGVGAIPPTPVFIFVHKTSAEMTAANAKVAPASADGVVYRPAVPVRVVVTVGGTTALDGYVQMCQYGQIAVAAAKYKPWAHMKTTAKFDATTGGLTEYGVNASSSAEQVAKTLDASASKLLTSFNEIQKAQATAAAAAATKPKEDLAAEKQLLQAQFDLDKLRAEYEKWKKDNPPHQ